MRMKKYGGGRKRKKGESGVERERGVKKGSEEEIGYR